MKFLLTNDDGIDGLGLATLAEVVSPLGEAVVIAPHIHLSGCSHQATTHRPLSLITLREGWQMLDGSPVDCTRVGLTHATPEVEWVLSGINEGGNLGADVFLSGTVAAAREACILGKPAIALSQYYRKGPIDWEPVRTWAEPVIRQLIERGPPFGGFWNVNFPDPQLVAQPECRFCPLDVNPLPVRFEVIDRKLHYRGSYHHRSRTVGHDVDLCFAGAITITPIRILVSGDERYDSTAIVPLNEA